jgi:enolase-phosphatase E1
MIEFFGSAILLDMEGIVCSSRYLPDTLMPYAQRHLAAFLERRWTDADVRAAALAISSAGLAEVFEVAERLLRLGEQTPPLVALESLLWEEGLEEGELSPPICFEVLPALGYWTQRGVEVCVIGRGSSAFQKALLAHSEFGDLSDFVRAFYDGTLGAKNAAETYAGIAAELDLAPREILFLSVSVESLAAARAAGLQTGLVLRPGHATIAQGCPFPHVASFDEIRIFTSAPSR